MPGNQGLSHVDAEGSVQMVDVGGKPHERRRAVAAGRVAMGPDTAAALRSLPKGDALAIAQVAGIMAAKRTADLIPLCHPLPLTSIDVEVGVGEHGVEIVATVETTAQTGVEMEALTAVSVAALTVYDMAKAVDRDMTIEGIRLLEKLEGVRAAVLTVSDGVSVGEREDASGDLLAEALAQDGWEVERRTVPDDRDEISTALRELAATTDLVLTTGGTGFGPRDVTPEATAEVLERGAPGIAEAVRADAVAKTPHGMLSRGTAGIAGSALVVNLPGSPGACRDGWAVLAPAVGHAVKLLASETTEHRQT